MMLSYYGVYVAFSCLSVTTFIHKSEAQCEMGNETHQAGDIWAADNCTEIYTCVESINSYITTTMCPVKSVTETLKGLGINETDVTMMIPSCCTNTLQTSTEGLVIEVNVTENLMTDLPYYTTDFNIAITTDTFNENVTGCLKNNNTFEVGEQHNLPDKCLYNHCEGNNQWIRKGCGLLVVPEGWKLSPMNTSKPYPECCEGLVPDLDIVPDILDSMPYVEFLEVAYENNVTVDKGRELTPTQVKSEPKIIFNADSSAWYTLCMVDPDAPSRKEPTFREILHWMVVNIPGNNVAAGEVIAGYRGSGAPKGTGLHRYVFFVFKQSGTLTFDEPRVTSTSRKHRLNFSLKTFSQKYSLGGIGRAKVKNKCTLITILYKLLVYFFLTF